MPTLHAAAQDSLQQLVACSRELYTLPRVAMRVLELTEQPNVDIPALRKCVELDPALTSKVLRVVNSSLFGLPRQVADLNHALTLLGVKPLKMLVLGFSLPPNLCEGLEADVLHGYWRRAIIKAVAAREIARRWAKIDGEEMLIAGLLQDLGVLVLLQQLGAPYCRFVRHAWQAGNQLVLLERELFGFDHAEITARLLHVWRLPPQLVAAVRVPATLSPTCPPAATILWMAELTATFLTSGDPELLASLYQSLATWKQVAAEQVETFLIDLQVQVEQLAGAFAVRPVGSQDYAAIVAAAQAQAAAQSQILAHILPLQSRATQVDRSQWEELIDALENRGAVPAAKAANAFESPSGSLPADRPANPAIASSYESLTATCETAVSREAAASTATCDADFLRHVSHAAGICRGKRCGLSLMLVEVDRADEVLLTRGIAFLPQLLDDCEAWLNAWLHTAAEVIALGDHRFALLLHDADRLAAARVGRRLMDAVTRATSDEAYHWPVTLSVGIGSIGLPPRNFDARNLVEAAERCLSGAQRSGGACLKSFEVY